MCASTVLCKTAASFPHTAAILGGGKVGFLILGFHFFHGPTVLLRFGFLACDSWERFAFAGRGPKDGQKWDMIASPKETKLVLMIEARHFADGAIARGYSFWSGVPCSFLTPLINCVIQDERLTYI